MIMDNSSHAHHQLVHSTLPLRVRSPQRAPLNVSTTPPLTPSPGHNTNSNNNNSDIVISPTATAVGSTKAGLKRSFDVAFLMMPDERITRKQAAKQACLSETLDRYPNYPTDLSPRQLIHQQPLHDLYQEQPDNKFATLPDVRRYPQITVRSPRIYDDPSVVLPDSDMVSSQPVKSAFTKVVNIRQESPIPPPQSLSPDQLSGSSMSPPISTPPPRTNSGNDSLSNGSGNGNSVLPAPPQIHPSIVYHNFRPEYSFNGAFHSVSQVQALQAAAAQNQRIRQQLLYRPPLTAAPTSNISSTAGTIGPDFLPGYPAFPFSPTSGPGAHHFAAVNPPELTRIPLQNPAAAAILSTLIPPTLASTLSLTAQNVCAKCNISFRMTSDLVYHMRSHHKSEVACDPHRRKREEKLKCPVCNESFRERHHLTRHMTAHQDKESDSAATSPVAANGSEPIVHVVGASGSSRNHTRNATPMTK